MDINSIKIRIHLPKNFLRVTFIITCLFCITSFPQIKEPRFEHITIEDGLPENSGTAIFQDHLGYMWFGTQRGLAKYDGYKMITYINSKVDPGSISGDYVQCIYEDHLNNLWIGTKPIKSAGGGLNRFDRSANKFIRYLHYQNDEKSINSNFIKCVYEDKAGNLWVGTDAGLNIFNREKENFIDIILPFRSYGTKESLIVENILEDRVTKKMLFATNYGLYSITRLNSNAPLSDFQIELIDNNELNWVTNLYQTRDGIIWLISDYKLYSYDSKNEKFTPYPITLSYKNAIFEDSYGTIWIGSSSKGVFSYDRKKSEFTLYNHNPNNIHSIGGNLVNCVYEDRSGNLWVGARLSGINKWNRHNSKFKTLEYDPKNNSKLLNKDVYSIYEDDNQQLWIGTNKGITILARETMVFKNKPNSSNDLNRLSKEQISNIIGDPARGNVFWISTLDAGVFRYDAIKKTLQQFKCIPGDSLTLSDSLVNTLENAEDNYLLIGTNRGLDLLNKKNKQLRKFDENISGPLKLENAQVITLLKDNLNNIWIGTNGNGLFKFEHGSKQLVSIKSLFDKRDYQTISVIFEDSKDRLWVGTFRDGIYHLDKKTIEIVHHYSFEDGLSNAGICGILDDEKGNLWISTNRGLLRLNILENTFRNFDISDGLCSNFFNLGASLKSKTGRMYFGTNAGLVYFHPDSIVVDSVPPLVVIQNISLFNRPDENLEYEGFISEIDEITLPYKHNDLHFEYVGLHYGEPQRNKYKYILEGFDKEWIDAGNLRTATYTNLDPGEYVFRVKASNSDGVWNEKGASLKIIINPPFWTTTWAYLFYLILFGSILYYAWRMQLKRVRVKHEFEMSKFEAQKLHEVDEMKSRFFANISHEFRTPLTLILGPVKQIIERTKETRTKEDLNLVHRNANRLLGLVNQLLDISKIESGNMKLQTTPINIIPYLKALVLSFTSYAERKRISLNFVSDVDEIIVYIDKDKFEKIINNILSNAFKFTPDDGLIKVVVNQHNENLKITVSDTGVGIPQEKLQKIFDRFYQVDGSHTREQEGTGIGLSLTKELIELHKGNIEVESEEGKGSSFIISIPLGTDHLKPDEIIELESEKTEHPITESILANTPVSKTNLPDIDLVTNTDKPILLIVEDNYDVRNYIRTNLDNGYRIIEAIDGEDGWNRSTNNLPDLIVSDVMMPRMDGFELCKKIKTDERTSHIPVILLTAKAAKQDKLDGYEIGADDYIMKPFEPDELRARIKNLIIQRKKLQEHFKKNGIFGFTQSQITSIDKKFLQNVLNKVNQRISDASFSVELLSDDLGISRSVVHRKILSLTGETPGELIRRIRLNKAAELIKNKFGNLSEIALEVGFNNPAHFSESFKKQFGVSPSHYQ
ncbi:MAG: response regulator [Ignavibacteriales bacterium]|nr:response regulator [Ignavibacteriales bacterium]